VGKRGPKPTPTAIRKARGNPGKRPLNQHEPQPEGKLPKCPTYLKGDAQKAYRAFAKHLTDTGIAKAMDVTALELLCGSYALYVDALQKVLEVGPVWLEKGESKIPKFAYSPYWAVKNREWKNVLSILREFGMTPSSRSNVQVLPKAASNPFTALITPQRN